MTPAERKIIVAYLEVVMFYEKRYAGQNYFAPAMYFQALGNAVHELSAKFGDPSLSKAVKKAKPRKPKPWKKQWKI